MITFLIVFLGLSLLVLAHEAGHFFSAKIFGLRVEEFGFGFPPKIAAIKKGETAYSINWLPFGGFVKIAGENREEDKFKLAAAEDKKRLFYFQPGWKRSVIILSGVFINFLIGWFIFWVLFIVGTPRVIIISKVLSGSPAEIAGFQKNDVVLGFSTISEFQNYINQHINQEISFEVIRGNEKIEIKATPSAEFSANKAPLGVEIFEGGIPAHSNIFKALYLSLKFSFYIIYLTLQGLGALIISLFTTGKLIEGVVGPVGIFSLASITGQIGIIYLFQLLGFISLNLSLINLLPFPALDGGRFALILVEKIKGSPLSLRIENAINYFGFIVLIILMILLTIRDVINLI